MAGFSIQEPWTFAFGMLGNIISFMVYLAPLPTFIKIYKRKSTEGFQSIPYVVSLFSAMLWIFYAWVKKDASLLITINSVGCLIEAFFIAVYLFYAPRKARILTVKLFLLFNVFGFGVILLITLFLEKDAKRIKFLGWTCLVFSMSVFVAPLCIMRRVIKTKSVEFMPFSLSFFLTLSAVMWFFYGFLLKDPYIAVPNILGFIFGVIQMVIYVIYKNTKKVLDEPKLQELSEHIIDVVRVSTMVCPELNPVVEGRQNVEEETDQNKRSMEMASVKD